MANIKTIPLPEEDNSTYRNETGGLIRKMSEASEEKVRQILEHIRVSEEPKQRVEFVDTDAGTQLNIQRPSNAERSNAIFLPALEDGLKMGELASVYLNISPQRFSMIRNKDNPNKPNPDLIVIAALVNLQPFSPEDVNHILMELELPGLFTDTYDQQINLRNYILTKLLDHAQHNTCPRERWIYFARDALDFLEMEPLQQLPGRADNLSVQEKQMLSRWLTEAQQNCVRTNYLHLRHEYLERCIQERGLNRSHAVSILAKESYTSVNAFRDVFNSKFHSVGTIGSRDTLIRGAIVLRCTLEETNLMLRQSNRALIYPFRENQLELNSMVQLIRNGVMRSQQSELDTEN